MAGALCRRNAKRSEASQSNSRPTSDQFPKGKHNVLLGLLLRGLKTGGQALVVGVGLGLGLANTVNLLHALVQQLLKLSNTALQGRVGVGAGGKGR